MVKTTGAGVPVRIGDIADVAIRSVRFTRS